MQLRSLFNEEKVIVIKTSVLCDVAREKQIQMRPRKEENSRKTRATSSPKERKSRKPASDRNENTGENPLHERTRGAEHGERRNARRDFFTERNGDRPQRTGRKRDERNDSGNNFSDREKRPYNKRNDDSRSSSRYGSDRFDRDNRGGDRKSFHRRDDDRTDNRENRDRRPSSRFGSDRFDRDNRRDDRKSFQRRDDDRNDNRENRDRRPSSRFGSDRSDRDNRGGDRKPFHRRDDDRNDNRENRDRRPSSRFGSDRFDRDNRGGDRKPFHRRDDDRNDNRENRDRRPSSRFGSDRFDRDNRRDDRKPYQRRDDDRDNNRENRDRRPSSRFGSDRFDRDNQRDDRRPFRRHDDRDDNRQYRDKEPRKGRSAVLDSDIMREIVQKRRETGRSSNKQKVLSLAWSEERGPIRLNKYISNSGISSRREADQLIIAGAVTVNGVITTELGTKVMPTDEVRYEDKILQREKPVYLLLNKPKDYITTTEDDRDRDSVMVLIEGACPERIYPVGRLDRNSTGLLLFTNDGEMAKKLTHPRYGIKKIYQVELDRDMSLADFETLANGVELSDGFIKPDEIAFVDEEKNILGITLHSGKNRIVRRMFDHLGYEVEKLDRVYYAGLTKKDLPRGEWRFLKQEELNILKMSL